MVFLAAFVAKPTNFSASIGLRAASPIPVIGLFGTVWGIIDAFSGLGSAGAASLRAVAPGIAEALVTTAAGLATAIPAVIFYNQFLQNIRDLGQRLDNFSMEVTAQVEKAFD